MKIGLDVEITHTMLTVTALAKMVEQAGLESLLFMQCTHVPKASEEAGEPGHEEDMFILDPLGAVAAAAAATSTLIVGTGALCAGLYDPIILARSLATLDQLSGGRLLVGVTPGYSAALFRDHGLRFEDRFRALRETCLAMRALWTQAEAEFHGDFVDFDSVVRGLPPIQQPHPPILVGSHGLPGIRRAVEYGDGWFPVLHGGLQLEADMAQLAEAAETGGRPRLPVTVFAWQLDEDKLERCAAAGVERVVIALKPRDRTTVDEFLQRCTTFAERFAA